MGYYDDRLVMRTLPLSVGVLGAACGPRGPGAGGRRAQEEAGTVSKEVVPAGPVAEDQTGCHSPAAEARPRQGPAAAERGQDQVLKL